MATAHALVAEEVSPVMRTDRRLHAEPRLPILCPCGCEVTGYLTKFDHARGCTCRSCLGRRNRRKGQKAEAGRHKALGGTGFTPRDELGHVYPILVVTQDKAGAQIPASFLKFTQSEFCRHAMWQAELATPIGSGAFPSVYLQPPGHTGRWLLVRVDGPLGGGDAIA
jgi:hypothetical protein